MCIRDRSCATFVVHANAAIMTWRTKACKKREQCWAPRQATTRDVLRSWSPKSATDLGATKAEAPAAHAKTIAQAVFMVSEVDLAQSWDGYSLLCAAAETIQPHADQNSIWWKTYSANRIFAEEKISHKYHVIALIKSRVCFIYSIKSNYNCDILFWFLLNIISVEERKRIRFVARSWWLVLVSTSKILLVKSFLVL